MMAEDVLAAAVESYIESGKHSDSYMYGLQFLFALLHRTALDELPDILIKYDFVDQLDAVRVAEILHNEFAKK